jgi:integrase
MASISRRGEKWLAQVCIHGQRKSKIFATKGQAKAWATRLEAEAAPHEFGTIPRKQVRDLLERYAREVSPRKKGMRWEQIRLDRICRADPLADVWLEDLNPSHIAEWRDRRLEVVKPGSVRREWNLLSNVFKTAVHEWGWLKQNPMSQVRRPPAPPPRDRRYTPDEIRRVCEAAGYSPDHLMLNQKVLVATGQAPGAGKTAAAKRRVPLSSRAVEILKQVSAVTAHKSQTVFDVGRDSMSTTFGTICDKANVHGATFHDSRHEATTRLAQKLNPLELAKTLGHKDLRMLMVYYEESAENIAKRLD